MIEIGLVTLFRYHDFFWNNSAIKIYDKIITLIWPSSTPTLNEIGISTNLFISSLISFNVGVELGQISIIILSYILIALFFQKKSWYRNRITKPISVIVASIGFYWFIQRLFF